MKFEKTKMEGEKEVEEQDVERSMKQKDHNNREIAALKQELEIAKKHMKSAAYKWKQKLRETNKSLEEVEGSWAPLDRFKE